MVTLYTAVGSLKFNNINGKPVPYIINNHIEYGMSKEELIVWRCLAFQILTHPELEQFCQKQLEASGESLSLPLAHFLNRLLLRGLLVKGDGVSGVDALYRLLGTLTITPIKSNLLSRLTGILILSVRGQFRLRDIPHFLRNPVFTPTEHIILSLAEKAPISTAELLLCVEHSIPIKGEADIMENLYTCASDTCDTLADTVQITHTQYPILQAVSNLYLNQQILFQKI